MTTNSSRIVYYCQKFVLQCISLTITSYYLHNYEQLGDLILVGGLLTSLEKKFCTAMLYGCYNYGYLGIVWGHWTQVNKKQSIVTIWLFSLHQSINSSHDWSRTHNDFILTSKLHHNGVIFRYSVQTKVQLIVLIFLLFNNSTTVSFFVLFWKQFQSQFAKNLNFQL